MTPRAERDLRRVGADHIERILNALVEMEVDPRRGDVRRLVGPELEWRRRVGDWRIRFAVDEDQHAVVVLRGLPRGSAYQM
jgi:mRNA-degrading endonuclease RelE of RelBE toxin-antitoxin system